MKTSFLMLAAVALFAAFVHFADIPSRAEAAVPSSSVQQAEADAVLGAAKWQATLAWDGGGGSGDGITQVVCLGSTQQTVQLQAVKSIATPNGNSYCYKTCTSITCVPDCTKDLVLNAPSVSNQTQDGGLPNTSYTWSSAPASNTSDPIQMGLDKCIVVRSLDAGNAQVNLYQLTKNVGQ